MKKAQGLSLNIIVVAAIVLIILIVLVVVFSGRIKVFSSQSSGTTSQYLSSSDDTRRCEMPGTNNACDLDRDVCRQQGGAYDDADDWDCYSGCCIK